MRSILMSVYKEIDIQIGNPKPNEDINLKWKEKFGTQPPQLLLYRLYFMGAIFSLYQENKIEEKDMRGLIHIMYYEKYIREELVEEAFLSNVDLDKRVYVRELNSCQCLFKLKKPVL